MLAIQLLPRDTSRPSVVALLVALAGLSMFIYRLKNRASYRESASSDTAHLVVNVVGPVFGIAGFGFALVVMVAQTIQGR